MKRYDNDHLPTLGADFADQQAALQTGDTAASDDDLSRYLAHIAHLDLPLECKIELLRLVQDIMRSFVDRAFGDDAAQLARKAGDEIRSSREAESEGVVASNHHHNTGDETLAGAFKTRADRATEKETFQP